MAAASRDAFATWIGLVLWCASGVILIGMRLNVGVAAGFGCSGFRPDSCARLFRIRFYRKILCHMSGYMERGSVEGEGNDLVVVFEVMAEDGLMRS